MSLHWIHYPDSETTSVCSSSSPNGTTCLPVNWRKNKHWLSRNQDSVSEWSDMSTSGLEEEQTWLSRNQDSVSQSMSTIGLEEDKPWLSRNQDSVSNGATCLPVDWRKNKHCCLGIRIVYPNGVHVYQFTGGRTNTGRLGFRIVYPIGATCLPVWRKFKHSSPLVDIRIVYPNGDDMSTSGLETCFSIGIHYPDSETTSVCSSSSPLVDMSLHWDTLS